MALAAVVSVFEIASTIGTYAGVAQNYMTKEDNRYCPITTSLSNARSQLILAFEGLGKFADILTDDECNDLRKKFDL